MTEAGAAPGQHLPCGCPVAASLFETKDGRRVLILHPAVGPVTPIVWCAEEIRWVDLTDAQLAALSEANTAGWGTAGGRVDPPPDDPGDLSGHVMRYRFGHVDDDAWFDSLCVYVERTADDRWVVQRFQSLLTDTGEWLPDLRDASDSGYPDYITRTRHPLDRAVTLARRAADQIWARSQERLSGWVSGAGGGGSTAGGRVDTAPDAPAAGCPPEGHDPAAPPGDPDSGR